jgi:hypothetical protein
VWRSTCSVQVAPTRLNVHTHSTYCNVATTIYPSAVHERPVPETRLPHRLPYVPFTQGPPTCASQIILSPVSAVYVHIRARAVHEIQVRTLSAERNLRSVSPTATIQTLPPNNQSTCSVRSEWFPSQQSYYSAGLVWRRSCS